MQEKPKNINLPECDISPDGIFVKEGGNKTDEYMSIYERIKTGIFTFHIKVCINQSNIQYLFN
jgi:hypothetical protein